MTGVSIAAPAPATAPTTAPAVAAPAAAPAPVVATTTPQAQVPGNGTTTPAPTTTTGVSLSPPVAAPPAGTTTPAADPWSALTPEHKTLVEAKGWKSQADMIKSYSELETRFSSTRPAEKPKAVTEYDAHIKPPADAEKTGYSKEFDSFYKNLAFESGMDVTAAAKFHEGLVKWAADSRANAAGKAAEMAQVSIDKAGAELTKVWGEPNTPQFSRNVEMSRRALSHLDPGLKAELIDVGALVVDANGQEMVAKPAIFKALSKVGSELYSEDALFANLNNVNINPFEQKTNDVTMQGRIVNEDPAKARQLIAALPPQEQQRYAYLLSKLNEKK